MKEGIIKFYGYDIEIMNYTKNYDYVETDKPIDLSPQFLFKLIINKETQQKFNIVMGVRIGYLNDYLPFKAEVILKGFYELKDQSYEKEEAEKFYLINGSAILFPYLRSILTDITSKGNHGPIVLPTLNFNTIVDDFDIKQIIVDSEDYEEFVR